MNAGNQRLEPEASVNVTEGSMTDYSVKLKLFCNVLWDHNGNDIPNEL